MSVLRLGRMAQEINSIVDPYLSWVDQLVRELAQVQVPAQGRMFFFKSWAARQAT